MGSKRNGLPIRIDNSKLEELQKPKLTAYVDASDSDWGISSELIRTHGFWSEAGKENSIHKEQSKRKHVLLYSNNRTAINTVDSRTTYQQPDHIDLPTHPRDAEHGRRQSQPQDYTFVGTTTSSNMVSPNQETIEGFDDRCIRSTSQSSTARILEPISRLGCGSSECVRSAVAEKRIISEHTLEINPQGNSQIKDRPGEFSSSCHATMVNAGMVADDPTSGQEEPNGVIKTTREFNITDRMEIINYYRKKKGLSPEVISVLRQKN
ncbi:hypothetical protein G6F70_006254 [Rhizopus microsporus]|nr:hypothetical protein G6F71_006172 [Rhizopus microsporus]KAG1197903.1 hypothetical protein G6F70_006254 [Rhizopus microsporus]KAG1209670.1 hypothetical protein G6F69_006151 [Rhizopus microsporus]KAG1231182.1 hypothetical protein G6F67_005933 [Rhizopus microsporus]CEJ03725.1 hypothetical protein RMCBS344292_17704 [Rhizopus microsporus]